MIKKHAKKEEPKAEFDLGLGGFLGGLFKGVEKIIELAEKAEKAGGELRKEGELRGGSKEKPIRGVYGFTIRTGLGQKTRVEPFGNISAKSGSHAGRQAGASGGKKTKEGLRISETREPIVDVFDEKDSIGVIAELPGVGENEIKLEVRGDILNLETAGDKKYAKEILLPAKVNGASKEMSFKNGILEVKFKKIYG